MSDPTSATAIAARTSQPPSAGTPDRASDALQKQLREKDQLVAALTERLEQAAEQLDRLRRTGADKGLRPAGSSLPPELVQDQKQTLAELKRFVGKWDEIDAGAALARIESQVVEIRSLISSGVTVGAAPSAAAAAPVPARERTASAPPAAATSAATAQGKTANSSWWEKQKAALLGESHETETPVAASPAAPAEAADVVAAQSDPPSPATNPADIVIPEPPPPLDFDSLTLEDAKQAIRLRDQVIQQLREPLLLLRAAAQLPRDLQSRESLPDAVRERLDELEAQWQARFRQAELDLSLERARLAREQAQLNHQQELLQKQLRQGGPAPREPAEAAEGDESATRRRWFRFMGKSDDSRDSPPSDPG